MSKYSKKCEVCGKEFETEYKHQKYCCEICKRKRDYQRHLVGERIFVCRFCGKEFKSKKKCAYCSTQCRGRYRRNSKRPSRAPKGALSLSEVARLAREQGLTYGQYMQREYAKKQVNADE